MFARKRAEGRVGERRWLAATIDLFENAVGNKTMIAKRLEVLCLFLRAMKGWMLLGVVFGRDLRV